MTRIRRAVLRRLVMPLHTPYHLSYRTFDEFEPYVVEVEDENGRSGFGDGHISPGSSAETREGGWAFCLARLTEIIGMEGGEAKAHLLSTFAASKVATTAMVTAIEMLEGHALLAIDTAVRLPLLTPTSARTRDEIQVEVDTRLAEGYRTFKIKVGKDRPYDAQRVADYQAALAGRGTIRIDANRAYSREDGIAFASALNPQGIELFEQPCDDADWDANAAVAQASTVPLMLDEPICTIADIDRAAELEGVGLCKLKLKRFGGMERLKDALEHVRVCGMEPVLGDGVGSELQNFLEACVARHTIANAGEFNGFLKCKDTFFDTPMTFANGAIQLSAGYVPKIDRQQLERLTVACEQRGA